MMSYKNKVIILLNSLPDSFNDVKLTIKYRRDSLTLDIVLNELRTRGLEMKKNKIKDYEALMVRDRTNKKFGKNSNRARSESQGRVKKRFYSRKEGQIRKNLL